jgi:hypothetical protein
MAYDEPLRITCEGCPRGATCDCLVDFILAERDAEVLPLDAAALPRRRRAQDLDLDADLARAFHALAADGLEPELLSVRRNGVPRAS